MNADYKDFVFHFLKIEKEALENTLNLLSPGEVEKAISLLLDCEGKVIVLGIGKSGIIGEKIAATMTSTGTPAVFIHATEAVHGGLGIVNETDVLITLSKSGETEEILNLIPHLKLKKIPIISIVGNINSSLAHYSDAILDASVSKEACPLNLAPTASTTVALAIGDALALSLMKAKNTTAELFAANHPSGSLGKKLTLKVKDVMNKVDKNPLIPDGALWKEILNRLEEFQLGAVNVVDNNNSLLGIITDGDVRRAIKKIAQIDLDTVRAKDIMTKHPIIAKPGMLAYDALLLMEDRPSQISVLPVVDNENKCVGLVRIHDIIRSGLK